MRAPVALFVYKRFEHTERLLESLAKNYLAEETELFIFSDGAKKAADQEAIDKVRALINHPKWKSQFKNVSIVAAESNKGLANSVINGVTGILEQYGKIIVVEDDLILSKAFLRYMNKALDFYENVPEIWSISGYSFPMKSLKNYPHDVFYGYRGCSWGWGTWKNRWDMVDWECKDYDAFVKDRNWVRKFNRGGRDMSQLMASQMEGRIDSWAIRWCFAQSNADMLTVYPKNSYIINEGFDGSGTHSGVSSVFSTEILDCAEEKMEKLTVDPKIAHEFWKVYSDTLDRKIIRKIRKLARIVRNQVRTMFFK